MNQIRNVIVEKIEKPRWSAKDVLDHFKGSELSELLELSVGQLRTFSDIDFYKVKVEIDDGGVGEFGPISRKLADQILQYQAEIPKFLLNLGAVECAFFDAMFKTKEIAVASGINDLKKDRMLECYLSLITLEIDGHHTEDIAQLASETGYWGQKWRLPESSKDGAESVLRNIKRVEKLRKAVGDDVKLMFELHREWDVGYLKAFMSDTLDLNITWLEEPFNSARSDFYEQCEGHGFKFALGEEASSLEGLYHYFHSSDPYVIQPDVVACGGIHSALKIRDAAINKNRLFAPHGRHLTPAIHVCAHNNDQWNPVLEFNPIFEAERQRSMQQKIVPNLGHIIFKPDDWKGLWQQ